MSHSSKHDFIRSFFGRILGLIGLLSKFTDLYVLFIFSAKYIGGFLHEILHVYHLTANISEKWTNTSPMKMFKQIVK